MYKVPHQSLSQHYTPAGKATRHPRRYIERVLWVLRYAAIIAQKTAWLAYASMTKFSYAIEAACMGCPTARG